MNRQFLDPVLRGEVAERLPELFGRDWSPFTPDDLELVHQPLDFLGVNYYKRGVAQDDPSRPLTRARALSPAGSTYTTLGWEVHPESFTRVLCWVKERYGDLPLYVTENGAAFDDAAPDADGRVEDPLRVRYYRDHLRAAREAMRRGVDLRGYFAWSLLDNFEWSAGYSKRFGLHYVDFASQRRSPKASARYYREVIRSHGAVLEEPLPAPAG
jgi:beta-glucosidase